MPPLASRQPLKHPINFPALIFPSPNRRFQFDRGYGLDDNPFWVIIQRPAQRHLSVCLSYSEKHRDEATAR